jgi:hypothetical protein
MSNCNQLYYKDDCIKSNLNAIKLAQILDKKYKGKPITLKEDNSALDPKLYKNKEWHKVYNYIIPKTPEDYIKIEKTKNKKVFKTFCKNANKCSEKRLKYQNECAKKINNIQPNDIEENKKNILINSHIEAIKKWNKISNNCINSFNKFSNHPNENINIQSGKGKGVYSCQKTIVHAGTRNTRKRNTRKRNTRKRNTRKRSTRKRSTRKRNTRKRSVHI